MKKKTGFFIISLVCVILCSTSCTFLGLGAYPQDTDSTDTGYIQLFLGSPSRSVFTASKDTTSRYRVSIEGTSIVHEFGPTAAGQQRIELNPGTYSVTLTALDAQSRETASNTKTVTVVAGRTTPVSFELKAGNVENTDFYLWNMGEKTISRFVNVPISLEAWDKEPVQYTEVSAFAEDGDGRLYYFDDSSSPAIRLYKDGLLLQFPEEFYWSGSFDDCLYYDCSTDMLWTCSVTGQLCGFSIADVRSQLGVETPARIEPKINEQVSSLNDGGITITTFAVRDSKVYVGYRCIQDNLEQSISVWNLGQLSLASKTLDLTGFGDCTDLAFVGDTLYALVCDYKRVDSSGISDFGETWNWNQGNSFYSRGALMQLSDSSEGLSIIKKVGWSETQSAEEVDSNPCQTYGPTKAESTSAFYGPRRFVAIKPKELYIVDCGTHIQFTNWKTAGTAEKPGHLTVGGEYFHERLVSVDLQSFGMSVLHDITTQNNYEQHGVSLFVEMAISGANSVYINSSAGLTWVMNNTRDLYFAAENYDEDSKKDAAYDSGLKNASYGGTFSVEEL